MEICEPCLNNCLEIYNEKKCYNEICKNCITYMCEDYKKNKINIKNFDISNLNLNSWEYIDNHIIKRKLINRYPCLYKNQDILNKLVYKIQHNPFEK